MSGRPMPTLAIPTQSASPSNQPTSPNGRPATWSVSAQRKMARLYLYTTLPVEKIRAIINGQQPPDKTIQQSSANKRLQTLFDKEPRWLHPRDEDDMGRRVTELANSPIQVRAASEVEFTSAHEGRDQSPLCGGSEYLDVGSRPSSASPSDAYSGSIHGSDAFPESQASRPYFLSDIPEESPSQNWGCRSNSAGVHPRESPFAKFLRATTFMTESSANTTGTFRKHLSEYAEPYVKVVKRLVKRFTSPAAGQLSTTPEHNLHVAWNEDWISDTEARTVFNIDIPLPGHLLSADFSTRFGHIPSIEPMWGDRISNSPGTFHWMTPEGPSPGAYMYLSMETNRHDPMVLDRHQHTVLHFLAAHAPFQVLYQVLCQALMSGTLKDIINVQNTAGQTFMHVIKDDELFGPEQVENLIRVVRALEFNMLARDCYGRSSLHVLTMLGKTIRFHSLHDLDPREYLQRDAFGIVPLIENFNPVPPRFGGGMSSDVLGFSRYAIPHPALDPALSNNPAVSQESQLVQNIRVSMENRFHEDEFGHNGLHCLAMATLSVGSIAEKHGLERGTESFGPHENRKVVDSSEQILELRRDTLSALLDAGQDPNHRDIFGNTPLMAFAAALPEENEYKLGPSILQLLISRGADVNARNQRGETALHIAVRFHRKLAARALVKMGANVDVRNSEFQSLLDVCDEKIQSEPQAYAKYSACRAWLSGPAHAVQSPSFWQEWEVKNRVVVD